MYLEGSWLEVAARLSSDTRGHHYYKAWPGRLKEYFAVKLM